MAHSLALIFHVIVSGNDGGYLLFSFCLVYVCI